MLTGQAKTDYQREYMRRRRADKGLTRKIRPKRDDRPYYDITPDDYLRLRASSVDGSFVYLFHCVDTDIYKIGKSDNPSSRINDIRGGCPYELELYAQTWLPSVTGAYAYESHLHKMFDTLRMEGEWFKLKEELVDIVIDDFMTPYSKKYKPIQFLKYRTLSEPEVVHPTAEEMRERLMSMSIAEIEAEQGWVPNWRLEMG
jgi:hypothetical protein